MLYVLDSPAFKVEDSIFQDLCYIVIILLSSLVYACPASNLIVNSFFNPQTGKKFRRFLYLSPLDQRSMEKIISGFKTAMGTRAERFSDSFIWKTLRCVRKDVASELFSVSSDDPFMAEDRSEKGHVIVIGDDIEERDDEMHLCYAMVVILSLYKDRYSSRGIFNIPEYAIARFTSYLSFSTSDYMHPKQKGNSVFALVFYSMKYFPKVCCDEESFLKQIKLCCMKCLDMSSMDRLYSNIHFESFFFCMIVRNLLHFPDVMERVQKCRIYEQMTNPYVFSLVLGPLIIKYGIDVDEKNSLIDDFLSIISKSANNVEILNNLSEISVSIFDHMFKHRCSFLRYKQIADECVGSILCGYENAFLSYEPERQILHIESFVELINAILVPTSVEKSTSYYATYSSLSPDHIPVNKVVIKDIEKDAMMSQDIMNIRYNALKSLDQIIMHGEFSLSDIIHMMEHLNTTMLSYLDLSPVSSEKDIPARVNIAASFVPLIKTAIIAICNEEEQITYANLNLIVSFVYNIFMITGTQDLSSIRGVSMESGSLSSLLELLK
ncbi:hypothetical protein ADUPG1_000440, partial [Aduncisulcus paluster]